MRTCPHDNYMHCAGKLARAAPITPTCVSLCDTTTYFTIHLLYVHERIMIVHWACRQV